MTTEQTQREMRPEYEAALVESGVEREAVFALRMKVFVEEQAVPPEEELDAYDVTATHFLLRRRNGFAMADPAAIVGTARLLDKGNGVGKVGRVAIEQAERGKGLGAVLMRFVEQTARLQGFRQLALDAQCYAIPFYEKLGYVAEGDVFLDAGIEHRFMVREL